MLRLFSESSRSYPGRSALQALSLSCNKSRHGPYRVTKVQASPAVADGDETRTTGSPCKRDFHCACQGNLPGDRTEVSRCHSSQTPGVMSRTG
jgi:hypothetical protein